MTRVKICGVTNLEDALLAEKLGADLLGFNFFERSPRFISPDHAAAIVRDLGHRIKKVGVFVNEETYKIGEIADRVGLDFVQLHGNEDPGFITDLRTKTSAAVIKAFRVGPRFEVGNSELFDVDHVLLDAFAPDHYGGTGKAFDWEIAQAAFALRSKLFLAGGLKPENVSEAIRLVQPYAVDVASGVESAPGKKDPDTMAAFIRNAKNA